jgi:hypothetical protein
MTFWRRSSEKVLERALREGRPRPSAQLERRLLDQMTAREPIARPRRYGRSLALAFVVVATALLATFVGIGAAASSTVEVASSTAATVSDQTTAVVKVVKRALKPSKSKPRPVTSSPASDQYDHDHITICHHPGPHSVTISIARSALPAHLAHGDKIGACPG